jgi:hypothetical protein
LANEVLSSKKANEIADAIYKIENSKKYPYGIKSIPIKGNTPQKREIYARKICLNTISNNYIRWQRAGKTNEFLFFLADRYCPSVCDPIGNINWKKNIKRMVDK